MGRRLKILYYDVAGSGGGSVRSLRTFLEALDRERFRPVVCLGGRPEEDDWGGFEVRRFSLAGLDNYDFFPAAPNLPWIYHALRFGIRAPLDYLRCLSLIEKTRPDIVHINCGQALTLGLAAGSLGKRCIWHVRELLGDNRLGGIQQLVYRSAADSIIAVSGAVARRLDRCGDKLVVVPNAVEMKPPAEEDLLAFRTLHGLHEGDFAVLLLGNFTRSKGYLFLAEVAERLADLDRLVFLVAGEDRDPPAGPGHRLLRRIYRGLKRSPGERAGIRRRWIGLVDRGRARLTGRVDAACAIAASDLVVCPNTVDEPFGRTAIEAWALGKPVLASRRENFTSLVEDGATGWLLPLEAAAWAKKIRELASDPRLAREAGKRGRARVAEFAPQRQAAAITALYQRLG